MGNDFLSGYNNVKKTEVLDLNISGLGQNVTVQDLKKYIGAKHVISATIEQDSIRNVCTGKGRIQVRVQEGENIDKLKMNLVKKGLNVSEFKNKANKNTGFSAAQKLQVKSPEREMDARTAKQMNLGS